MLEHTDAGIITRSSETHKISALAYHYPPEITQTIPGSFDSRQVAEATLATGSPAELIIEIDGLTPGAELRVEIIDQDHGDALAAWKKMDSPDPISREQTKQLKEAAQATRIEHHVAASDGTFRYARTLEPWSLVGLRQL